MLLLCMMQENNLLDVVDLPLVLKIAENEAKWKDWIRNEAANRLTSVSRALGFIQDITLPSPYFGDEISEGHENLDLT